MSARRKKRRSIAYKDVDLNIMPFIDIFSMLNTFLLFSAVFLSIGVVEVQLPFLSNAPAEDKEEKRSLEVKVEVESRLARLITSYSAPPINETATEYALDERGMSEFHAKLVSLRRDNEETSKVTVFSEDDVTFEQLTHVLDAIKTRRDGDPEFYTINDKTGERQISVHVFPQVVMGSVIL